MNAVQAPAQRRGVDDVARPENSHSGDSQCLGEVPGAAVVANNYSRAGQERHKPAHIQVPRQGTDVGGGCLFRDLCGQSLFTPVPDDNNPEPVRGARRRKFSKPHNRRAIRQS